MFKRISPAIFGIALICFFLPFINVNCNGRKALSLTGIQLVTGTTYETIPLFYAKETKEIKSNPLAVLTFISIIVGIGLSFLKTKKGIIVSAIIGAAGAVLLLLLKSKLDSEIMREGGGMVQIEYTVIFWLTFLLNVSAAIFNGFLFSQDKGKRKPFLE